MIHKQQKHQLTHIYYHDVLVDGGGGGGRVNWEDPDAPEVPGAPDAPAGGGGGGSYEGGDPEGVLGEARFFLFFLRASSRSDRS
ncbi:hypothetical protein Tco_0134497 [Tanacetum coccineum]